jgi:NitT/TauT family transport system permease protein
LQSVPILGFFPAAVAVFVGLFGRSALGVEAAAVFLIFTSMFWNLAFGVYGSLIALPEELKLAAEHLGLRGPLRWSRLVVPAVMPGLVYNSILSWANGWYFLMASEIIAVGPARYTLPGLGSYLGQAITQGRYDRLVLGLGAQLATSLLIHLMLWSPLATWAERFQLDESGDRPRTPRIGRLLARSRIVRWAGRRVIAPLAQRALLLAGWILHGARLGGVGGGVAVAFLALALLVGLRLLWVLVSNRPLSPQAHEIPLNLLLSLTRVGAGVALALLLAVPLAHLSFRHARLRSPTLSVLQILSSVPATAFFPLIALLMVRLGLGMDVGSVLLVLTGTFPYVMFNALSGAAVIPKETNEAAAMLGLRGLLYLRRVFVPAVLPRLVTGCVTAWGAGWNAIIFSEYVVADGRLYSVDGIGATLDRATYVTGDAQVIALSLVSMVALVILVNRLFWDPLYRRVAARYKMEA